MGSAMLLLDRALLSSCSKDFAMCDGLVANSQFAMQILAGIPTPSLLPVGRREPPSNTVLLVTTPVSLPNGISCYSRVNECDRRTT